MEMENITYIEPNAVFITRTAVDSICIQYNLPSSYEVIPLLQNVLRNPHKYLKSHLSSLAIEIIQSKKVIDMYVAITCNDSDPQFFKIQRDKPDFVEDIKVRFWNVDYLYKSKQVIRFWGFN